MLSKTMRITGMKAVQLEERTVSNKLTMYVIVNSNAFLNNEKSFIAMYVKQHCNVNIEGPTIHYFNHEIINADIEEAVVVDVVETIEEETTIFGQYR
jgi:hypothetical protein